MGTSYAVDIIFQAIDQSQRGTTSFLRQIEQVDSAIKRTTAGGGAGGAAGGGSTSSVDSLFAGLSSRLMAVAAMRVGIDAVTAGFKMWQYESMKLTAPLDEVLKKHIEINTATQNMVRDIPFIGRAAARMMEAFSDTEGLKHVASLLDGVQKSTERTFESIRKGVYEIQRMKLENIGAPGSEIKAVDIQAQRATRQEEIDRLKKEVETAKRGIREKEEIETRAARTKSIGYNILHLTKPGEINVPIDRTESERAKKEKLAPAQEALRQKEAEDTQFRASEKDRLTRMRKEEGEQRLAVQQKEMERRNKERGDELSWERDQRQRAEELEAAQIKDKGEREKKTIEIKYRYEIQKAREAFHDTSLLEEQRRLELAGVKPDEIKGRSHPSGKTPAEDVRFMSGAYGYNAGYDPAAQTARHAGTQVELMQKMNRKFDELIHLVRGQPGVNLRFSNFS